MSGTPVFAHTRVPFTTLFDYLEIGDTLEAFLDDFPSVTREQALEALRRSPDLLIRAEHAVE